MRITLGMIGIAAVAVLAVGAWGPLPSTPKFRARVLRARLTLGLSCPEDRYQFAEQLYEIGDFEKALLQCEKVLQGNSRHAPALALRTELLFILGRGTATAASNNYDVYMHRSFIPKEQLLIEIDHALTRGERLRSEGEREAALMEVRKVLEFVKWLPEGDELNARRSQAQLLKMLLATDGSTDD